jgi:membrane-associated protease RseP (regulator of RpoE activity)
MENIGPLNVAAFEEISNEVKKNFNVLESYVRSDGTIEYKLSLEKDTKDKFLGLCSFLREKMYIPILRKEGDFLTLYVAPYVKKKKYSVKIALALFGATIISLLVDGWLRASSPINLKIFPESNPIFVTLSYALAFIGILGLHELGHLLMARRHQMASTLPYFIPGIPGTGIPTFGAIIFATDPMPNRDIQFDVGLFGPLAGFITTILVGVFGVLSSVTLPLSTFNSLFGSNQATFTNIPLLMNLMMTMLGKVSISDEVVVIMSPIAYAAWFGFLITFLNTLPAWQLDGGHMARSVLSGRQQRIATFISAIIMAIFGFFLMALLVLFLSSGQSNIRPLDEISPLSRSRKIVFVIMIAVVILCAPIPI